MAVASMPRVGNKSPARARKATGLKQARSEDSRNRILTVATDMFLANGYDGASLDEIVRSSGASKTRIYTYFGGKDGLFRACIELLCDELLEELETDLRHENIEMALEDYSLKIIAINRNPRKRAMYWVVAAESRRFPEVAQLFSEQGHDQVRTILGDLLSTFVDRKELKPLDPKMMADVFLAMLAGSFGINTVGFDLEPTPEVDLQERVREVIGLFLHGAAQDNTGHT